jgi:hypothetical protein
MRVVAGLVWAEIPVALWRNDDRLLARPHFDVFGRDVWHDNCRGRVTRRRILPERGQADQCPGPLGRMAEITAIRSMECAEGKQSAAATDNNRSPAACVRATCRRAGRVHAGRARRRGASATRLSMRRCARTASRRSARVRGSPALSARMPASTTARRPHCICGKRTGENDHQYCCNATVLQQAVFSPTCQRAAG